MNRNLTPLPIRIFYSFFYFFNRFRFLTLTIVLGIAAFVTYQLWSQLMQGTYSMNIQKSNNGSYEIIMKYPDRMMKNEENEFIIFAKRVENDLDKEYFIPVDVYLDPQNIVTSNLPEINIQLKKNEKSSIKQIVTLIYNKKTSSNDDLKFNLRANPNSTKEIKLAATIEVENFSKQVKAIFSFMSALLSGLASIITAVLYIRELIKKK